MGKCKIKGTPAEYIADKVGFAKALDISSKTDAFTVSSITGVKAGDVLNELDFTKSMSKIYDFNSNFDTSLNIDVTQNKDNTYTVNSVNDNYDKTSDAVIYSMMSLNSKSLPLLKSINNRLAEEKESELLDPKVSISEAASVASVNSSTGHRRSVAASIHKHNFNKTVKEDNYGYTPMELAEDELKAIEDEQIREQIKYIQDKLGIKVNLTEDEDFHGSVNYDGNNNPYVTLSKKKVREDTVFHEAIGHIYINSIGGLNNPRVAKLANDLSKTDRFKEILENNPEMEEEQAKLEIVAESVGKEATALFNNKPQIDSFNRFKKWLYAQISKLFKTSNNIAKQLAEEGINRKSLTNESSFIPTYIQYDKSPPSDHFKSLKGTKVKNSGSHVEFDKKSHKYKLGDVIASRSVTEMISSDEFAEMPIDSNGEYVIPGVEFYKDNMNNLPLAVKNAMSDKSVYSINELFDNKELLEDVGKLAISTAMGYDIQADYGTYVHDLLETAIDANKWVAEDKKLQPIYDFVHDLVDEYAEKGYKPVSEARLFDKSKKIAGSVDLIFVKQSTGEFAVYDFKTRNEKNPVTDIHRKRKYAKQLAAYANLIEKLYPGLEFNGDATILTLPIDIDFENSESKGLLSSIEPTIDNVDKISRNKSLWTPIYSELGQQTGNISLSVSESNELKETVESVSKKIKNMLNGLLNSNNGLINRPYKDNVISTIERLGKLDDLEGLNEFIRISEIELSELQLKYDNIHENSLGTSANEIRELQVRYEKLSILSDVNNVLNEMLTGMDKADKDYDVIFKMSASAAKIKNKAASRYTSLKDDATSKWGFILATLGNSGAIDMKERLERKFEDENPPVNELARNMFKLDGKLVNSSVWTLARDNYVFENLSKSKDAVFEKDKKMWMDYIKNGSYDITWMDALVSDASMTRSVLVQTVNAFLSDREDAAREVMITEGLAFDKKVADYIKRKGISYKQLHGEIIDLDKDGNPTGLFISEYKGSLLHEYRRLQNIMQEIHADESKNDDDFKKARKELNVFIKKNIVNGKPIKKWENKGYAKHKDFLENVIYPQIKRSDSHVENKLSRTYKKLGKIDYYSIPQVRKEGGEYRNELNLTGYAKDKISDLWDFKKIGSGDILELESSENESLKKEAEDMSNEDELRMVKLNLKGELNKRIPMYYRHELPIDELSFDLTTSLQKNHEKAIEYGMRSGMQNELEMLLDIVKESRPLDTIGMDKKKQFDKDSLTNEVVRKSSGDSNEYKLLKSVIETRLYGRRSTTVDAGAFGPNRMSKMINGYVSKTFLLGNWMGASVNLMQGKFNNMLEGSFGRHMEKGALNAAEKDFWGDSRNWMNDVGSNISKSRTSILLKQFNIQGEFAMISNPTFRKDLFQKIVNKDHMFFMHSMGEFYIEATLMYGMLNSIKLMDNKGNYLGKNGKVVKEVSKAASLNDAITVKDGKIDYSIKFYTTSQNPYKAYDRGRTGLYIRDVMADASGQYDDKMVSHAQKTAFGRLSFNMRKWIPRTVHKRLKGMTYAFTDYDKLDIHKKGYNEAKTEFNEGIYSSTARFITGLARSIKKNKSLMVGENWSKLTDGQRKNIHQTIAESTMMVMTGLLGVLFLGLHDDDEDDKFLASITYMINRLHSEMLFYRDPNEAMNILRSPLTSTTMIENGGKLIARSLHGPTEDDGWYETYQSGWRKGDSKMMKEFIGLTPFKQFAMYGDMKALPSKVDIFNK